MMRFAVPEQCYELPGISVKEISNCKEVCTSIDLTHMPTTSVMGIMQAALTSFSFTKAGMFDAQSLILTSKQGTRHS